MKVLVACEYSGRVRDAFIAQGHDAISCDLLPTESDGPHYQGDVTDILNDGFDLMVAHPPCTHLAVSGSRHFWRKEKEQKEALDFVRLLMNAPIKRWCIENPVSVISSCIRPPDQIIQPWEFGHEAQKTTCLWLKNLNRLKPTKRVAKGEFCITKGGNKLPAWYSNANAKVRSATFQGIADAMGNQWGNESKLPTPIEQLCLLLTA